MKSWLGFIVCGTVLPFWGSAQITPAGFDHTNFVSWESVGILQNFDSLGAKRLQVYLGMARESRPDDANLFERPGIFVSDQQFQHKFRPRLSYTAGLSYRLQHHYSGTYPFAHDTPSKLHELRVYGAFGWIAPVKGIEWDLTYKQELRTFFSTENAHVDPSLKLRSRFKSRWKYTPGTHKVHHFIVQAEVLFALGKVKGHGWERPRYSDTRIAAFYALQPRKYACRLEVGYMHQIQGVNAAEHIHFLAVNILWLNPFK